ncbi:MAG: ATP-dependent sacrificial sulfur transferase LarE [Planctomycetota bacterium]
MTTGKQLADRLIAQVKPYGSCAVAFSAGVDSTVVAKAARVALGDRAAAVTGVGPALAEGELEAARRLAALIGIRHVEAETGEIESPGYTANAPDRCFHCKTELYDHVRRVAGELSIDVIANGANADDRGDYRPGMIAAADFGVRSPLLECGLAKADVRRLAEHWSLPVADKPAAPCLASRIAYGVEVTPERLRQIDLAEQYLRSLGLREVRVRLHEGELARVEAPESEVARLCEPANRRGVVERLSRLGFRFVTIDLAGFRSGSLNALVPLEALAASSNRPKR